MLTRAVIFCVCPPHQPTPASPSHQARVREKVALHHQNREKVEAVKGPISSRKEDEEEILLLGLTEIDREVPVSQTEGKRNYLEERRSDVVQGCQEFCC